MDLGISVSLSCGLFKSFSKKHRKYQAKRNFWVALLMFLMCSFLFRVFPFLGACCTWAMLALSQAHVEKKSSHVELLLRPFQPMLGQCGATLVYVGTVLGHVVSSIGPMLCWAYVDACCTNMEPCCPMLGRCWLMWGRPYLIFDIGLILSHFVPILGSCWAILGYVLAFILFRCRWVLGPCTAFVKKYTKHTEKQHVLALLLMCLVLCLTMFARYFSGVGVAFEWYFWWCMGGLLLVSVLVVVAWLVVSSHNMGWYFNGVLHPRAQTQYTSIHNIKQSCTLVARDISSAFPVLSGMT